MPSAWAAAAAAAITFRTVAVPIVAPDIDVIPTHPAISSQGWVGFVAQDGKKHCEVSLWRVTEGRADAALRRPCERGDAFYNIVPTPDGGGAELVALGADGVTRLFPGPRARVIRSTTFAAVAPVVRSPGPELWLADGSPLDPLRVAIPSFNDVTIWEREAPASAPPADATAGAAPVLRAPDASATGAPGDEHWHRVERYRVQVDARYNPRIGRDTLSPDFAMLAHLRMPKWARGVVDTSGQTGLLYALENEVTGVRADDGDSSDAESFRVEKVLFPDDPDGNDPRLVRGNRIGDVDGDGQLDIAMVASRGGITRLETAFDVWFGPLADGLKREPDVSVRGAGAAVGTELVDVDGDHRLEAVRPKVEVSISAFVRILLFGEVRIDYEIYDLARGKSGEIRPFCTFPRTFPVDLEGLSAKAVPLFTTEGDFDGDGLRDVLTGEGTKGYSIIRGRRAEGGRWCLAEGDGSPIDVAKAEALTVRALDDDDASDLIVVHGAGGHDSTVALLLSARTGSSTAPPSRP